MPAQQNDPPWPDTTMPPALMDWIGDLYDWLKDNRIVGSPTVYLNDAPGGGKSANVGTSGGTNLSFNPFKLLNASTDSTKKIRVVYGTVSGVMPSGFSSGDVPPYIVNVVGSSGIVYIEVTTDADGNITSRSVGIAATMPADSDGDYHLEIGSYSVTGETLSIAQAISGSQSFELCGGVSPQWGLS